MTVISNDMSQAENSGFHY